MPHSQGPSNNSYPELNQPNPRIHNYLFNYYLPPWLMEPGGLMSHSQGPSNNSYPELNQPNPRIDTYFFNPSSGYFPYHLKLPQ
jgi:hypothetical protein